MASGEGGKGLGGALFEAGTRLVARAAEKVLSDPRGQEAVARMWQLGRPRRRLVVLSSDDPLSPGPVGDERAIEVTRSATIGDHHVALGFGPRDVAVGDRPADGGVVRARQPSTAQQKLKRRSCSCHMLRLRGRPRGLRA